MSVELLNCDCMTYMKDQPDNAFDLAIVDPPYGIGDFRQGGSKKHHDKISWNNSIPDEEYFTELARISKHRIIWGANYYGKYINDVGRLIHDKTGGKRNQPKGLSDADIASHSFGVNIKIFRYLWCGNVSEKGINWTSAKIHPCEKPVELYKWLLTNYAEPGQRILDTHLGSGSSAIAAHYFGCDFVGMEIDEDYYKAAKERFERETAQLAMFV